MVVDVKNVKCIIKKYHWKHHKTKNSRNAKNLNFFHQYLRARFMSEMEPKSIAYARLFSVSIVQRIICVTMREIFLCSVTSSEAEIHLTRELIPIQPKIYHRQFKFMGRLREKEAFSCTIMDIQEFSFTDNNWTIVLRPDPLASMSNVQLIILIDLLVIDAQRNWNALNESGT